MKREVIKRNDVGQYTGNIPDEIKSRTNEFCDKLFSEFSDVDLFDIETLITTELKKCITFTMLKEAGKKDQS